MGQGGGGGEGRRGRAKEREREKGGGGRGQGSGEGEKEIQKGERVWLICYLLDYRYHEQIIQWTIIFCISLAKGTFSTVCRWLHCRVMP